MTWDRILKIINWSLPVAGLGLMIFIGFNLYHRLLPHHRLIRLPKRFLSIDKALPERRVPWPYLHQRETASGRGSRMPR